MAHRYSSTGKTGSTARGFPYAKYALAARQLVREQRVVRELITEVQNIKLGASIRPQGKFAGGDQYFPRRALQDDDWHVDWWRSTVAGSFRDEVFSGQQRKHALQPLDTICAGKIKLYTHGHNATHGWTGRHAGRSAATSGAIFDLSRQSPAAVHIIANKSRRYCTCRDSGAECQCDGKYPSSPGGWDALTHLQRCAR